MDKYVCKKSFGTIPDSDIFEIGKSYWGFYDEILFRYFITNHDNYIATTPMFGFEEFEKKEYFMTIDENRELEIDKIISEND
tara:strand:- start:42433 stop:42678 length:246 start_codon:yes stop_codon:yes gene_type:complete